MKEHSTFRDKWGTMVGKDVASLSIDETSLYIPPGTTPQTQRQLNLYNYFLFIRDILATIEAKDVLEAGSGRGTISLYLAGHCGLSVTLLDIVPDALEVAKADFDKRGVPATYIAGDVLSMEFPDASFDAAVSIGLAEHFEGASVERLFAEQYRVLRPGGVMISLNIPKKFSIQFLNTVMRFFKKLVGAYTEKLNKDYYRNDLTPQDFKRAASGAGFEKLSVTHVCPFPVYVPVTMAADKRIAKLNKTILKLRGLFQRYPYKTNPLVAQAHFLVGYKPSRGD